MPAVRAAARNARSRANPESDPRYRAVVDKLKAGSARLKQHPTPARKAQEASRAAKSPPNERLAGAKAKQVDKIQEAPTKKPEPTSFLAMLQAEIAKVMPKTLGDTEKFMQGGNAGAIKSSLQGNVAQQKEQASGGVKDASRQAPNPSGVPEKPSAPIPGEPTPPAPAVNGAEAMPGPKPDAEVSLQQSKQDTEQQMQEAKVTPDQLQKANDPRFSAVLSAKTQVAKQADAGPGKYRAQETAGIGQAGAQAGSAVGKGVLALVVIKGGNKVAVLSRQAAAKAKEEAERKAVADRIEGIYNKTKAKVEQLLAGLDTEVGAIFDRGVDGAIAAMKSYVDDRIFRYKLERYLSIPVVGLARWLRDQALGLPDEVNAFYVAGRQLFESKMNRVIVQVANLVESKLQQAKREVASGQAEIRTYVAGLPANLKAAGQAAEKAVGDRFADLERSIDDKKNELAQQLAQKYKEAFDKADAALKSIQDENKGLVQQFAEKLGEVIKALMEFKDKLMAILRKGAETIELILKDPIGFLGNLIGAIKQGFQQFVGNIWTHLKKGFMKWLFGALASAGIQIPADLTLPSILKLVLSVLGITYERMRAKAVKLIGERAVGAIEKVVEYITVLVRGGPAALWEKVKEDLASLKQMVIDAIQDWLITTIVKQAVAKIVSMFNPAGAIVQAVLAIYNVVMFVVERAAQIMEFVDSVINSIQAIASGAIGGAAAWIERALGNMVPILIGFLASLLGLGGISAKIREFILKVQGKVDKAIDKAIAKIVETVKKLFGGGKNKEDKRTEEQKAADLKKAMAEATQVTADKKTTVKAATKKFLAIKKRYQMTALELVPKEGSGKQQTIHIRGEINPKDEKDVNKPKVEMDHVDVDFKCKKTVGNKQGLDETEFKNQIKVQLSLLKDMAVKTFLSRRAEFRNRLAEQKAKGHKSPQGRDPEGDRLATLHRAKKVAELASALSKANPALSSDEAKALATDQLKDKAVIHKLDQIAGGKGTEVEEELGDARVDFSIGAQWRAASRIGAIEAAAEKVPEEAREDVKLNVAISVNGSNVV